MSPKRQPKLLRNRSPRGKEREISSERIESFENECSQLSRLETFDPQAFCEDSQVPQSLCNFVLALSLIYNDLKDLFFANVLLQDNKPSGSFEKTRHWGNYSGVNLHILRLMIGVLHELLNLIDEAKDDLDHPFLREVVRLMPANSRKAWDQVVNVGLGGSTATAELGKFLLRIRNNVLSHYGPKAIHVGFKKHFVGAQKADDCAYISRGDSIRATRFYFADAAVDGLLKEFAQNNPEDLASEFRKLLGAVCGPLIFIVVRFIQKRGFGFRLESGSL